MTPTVSFDLSVSIFESVDANQTPTTRSMSWNALCQQLAEPKREHARKADCPLLKLATFGDQRSKRGAVRHDANVLKVSGVEGDYDDELVSLDEAADKLAALGVAAFFYTSPSHTPAKPRWRVLAPLSAPCGPEARRHHAGLLNAALGGILSAESFVLSQVFYIGKVSGAPYASRRVPGRPLDEVLDLICEPVFPPGKAAATVPTDALDEAVRAAEISRVDAATVAELASALEVLDPDEPKKWIDIGYALASLKNTEHGEQARDLWIDWIQRGAKYQDGDERRWDGLDATRTDFRAIFTKAERKGWANPRKAVLETERDRSIRIARDGEYQVPTQRVLTGTEMLAELVYIKEGARVAFLAKPRFVQPLSEFRSSTAGSIEKVKGPKNSTRKVHRASLWLEHAERKTVETITFAPGRGPTTESPEGALSLNLWVPRTAQAPANWRELAQPFFEHVAYLVPVEAERERFLDWLAHIEQQPGVLPHTHYLLFTRQTGIGRNWLAYALARVFAGYTALGFDLAESLRTGFNGALSQRVLAVVDELHEGGPGGTTRPVAEKLKSLLTEATRRVNPKYGRQHVEFNCCRFLMLSNHEAALPLAENDRRVVVLENPSDRRSPDYYARLYRMLDDPSLGPALAEAFRQRDISAFNPGEVAPMSAAKAKTIRAGRSEIEQAVRDVAAQWPSDCIKAGRLHDAVSETLGTRVERIQGATLAAGLVKAGRIKVAGVAQHVWILRNADRWLGEHRVAVAAEVLRGDSDMD